MAGQGPCADFGESLRVRYDEKTIFFKVHASFAFAYFFLTLYLTDPQHVHQAQANHHAVHPV
jgi:hypothetical protein